MDLAKRLVIELLHLIAGAKTAIHLTKKKNQTKNRNQRPDDKTLLFFYRRSLKIGKNYRVDHQFHSAVVLRSAEKGHEKTQRLCNPRQSSVCMRGRPLLYCCAL